MAPPRSRILIAIGDVGAGHRVPAAAIRDVIETLHPGRYEVTLVDFFSFRDPSPFPGGSESSVRATSRSAWLSRLNRTFWHLSNSRAFHPFERTFVKQRCARNYFSLLRERSPDLLITVHPYLSELLGPWRDQLGFRHASVILELGTPMRSSASDSFDLAFSPTQETTTQLHRMGAPEKKIVTGLFPFRPDLLTVRSREEVAEELGFDPALPTLLLCGGGSSIAAMRDAITRLVRAGRQLLIATGNNTAFAEKIRRDFPDSRLVKTVGFVENIQDYYALADLIIAKPGASTVMEIGVHGRPCLLTAPVGPQEDGNVRYALRNPRFRLAGSFSPSFDHLVEEMLDSRHGSKTRRRIGETTEIVRRSLSLLD